MARVLITGAAGFIGMHTTIRFLKEGWDVIAVDNFNSYYSVILKRKRLEEIRKYAAEFQCDFVIYEKDINSDLWKSLENTKIDALIHLAAQAGVRYSLDNPREYLNTNVLGFHSVLEFVQHKHIDNFLYASSSSVYGKQTSQPFVEDLTCESPESYYAATKKMNELMTYSFHQTAHVSSIGLRFFTVYGPWGRPDMAPMIFANAALENEQIKVFNMGNQKRDFTYITDIVEAIYSLCVNNGKGTLTYPHWNIFNIGNGEPVNLMEFIQTIETSLDIEIDKTFLPEQPGDVMETYSNTDKLNRVIGSREKVKIQDGVDKFIEWFIEYKKDNF